MASIRDRKEGRGRGRSISKAISEVSSSFEVSTGALDEVTTDEKPERDRGRCRCRCPLNLSGRETSLLSLYCPATGLVILPRRAKIHRSNTLAGAHTYARAHLLRFTRNPRIVERRVRTCALPPLRSRYLSFVEEDRRCPGTVAARLLCRRFARTKRPSTPGDTRARKFNSFN